MLWTLTSKLWNRGRDLCSKSYQLGVRNEANRIVHRKAIEQFGEQNVEARWSIEYEESQYFNTSIRGLLKCFGSFHDSITLLIHWDKVMVTNEEDRSTEIKDLFCKLVFRNGCYRSMYFLRTTFKQSEWDVRYAHSHLHQFDCTRPVSWGGMCLGSGPINSTRDILRDGNYAEETLDVFFWELDKVVHVESLAGVPYIRMETIGNTVTNRADIAFNRISLNPGLKKFMQSFFAAVKIPLGYENGQYVCGCTFMDFAIMVTNYWNKYEKVFREAPYNTGIIKTTYILKDGAVYTSNSRQHDYSWRQLDTAINAITFKDTLYRLTIISDEGEAGCVKQLVDLSLVRYIQRAYLALVNMKFSKSNYGKKEEERRNDKNIYSLCTSSGICSVNSQYGADPKDTFVFL